MLYCQILLELCQFINVRFLQDFSNPDAEVVIDDHHIASGDALAVDQQIHRLARQLIQHPIPKSSIDTSSQQILRWIIEKNAPRVAHHRKKA